MDSVWPSTIKLCRVESFVRCVQDTEPGRGLPKDRRNVPTDYKCRRDSHFPYDKWTDGGE